MPDVTDLKPSNTSKKGFSFISVIFISFVVFGAIVVGSIILLVVIGVVRDNQRKAENWQAGKPSDLSRSYTSTLFNYSFNYPQDAGIGDYKDDIVRVSLNGHSCYIFVTTEDKTYIDERKVPDVYKKIKDVEQAGNRWEEYHVVFNPGSPIFESFSVARSTKLGSYNYIFQSNNEAFPDKFSPHCEAIFSTFKFLD